MSACRAPADAEWPHGFLIPAEPLVKGGDFDHTFLGWPLGSIAAKLAEDYFEEITPNWVAG